VNGLWYYPTPDDGRALHTSTVELALRYYPSGRRFQGLAIAPTVGMYRERQTAPPGCLGGPTGCPARVASVATVGLRADYQRLLGPDERLAVTIGLGAQRLLNRQEGDGLPFSRMMPRLSLGWAF
jgi:hypothetical protein